MIGRKIKFKMGFETDSKEFATKIGHFLGVGIDTDADGIVFPIVFVESSDGRIQCPLVENVQFLNPLATDGKI